MMRWLAMVVLAAGAMSAHAQAPAVSRAVPATLPMSPATLPAAPMGERSFRAVVISDFNASYGSTTYGPTVHAAVRLIVERIKPEVVVSAGDLIAGQRRTLTDENITAMWSGFEASVAAPLREAGIAFAPVPGNHDGSGYPGFEREREAYARHWRGPATRPALKYTDDTDFPFTYSFEHKGVAFVALDITTMNRVTEGEWERLGRLLNRSAGASAVVALSHVPPYAYAVGRERETIPPPDDDRMVDELAKHAVSVWFTGHHHAYFKTRVRGLNLVSLNCCGNGPRRLMGTEQPQEQSFVVMDVVDGRVAAVFAVRTDGTVVDERRLPERIPATQDAGVAVPELLRADLVKN